MSDVVVAELVEDAPDSQLATTTKALTPKKRRDILDRLDAKMAAEDDIDRYNWTLTSLARSARISPKTFIAVLHGAAESPSHRLHNFAMDVFERWGKREEWLIAKGLRAADHKNDFAGFVTMLERSHEGWEQSKHRKETKGPTIVNYGQMMIAAQNSRGSLRPGD